MNEWETCIDEWAERLRVSQKETADAQATIADLQEKIAVERANKESAVACVDRDVKKISALQQRVAQLEGDVRGRESRIEALRRELARVMVDRQTLQADHATLLGLVQDTVQFFESNFENAGRELCGLVNGKDITPTGQRLNELIEQLAASLPAHRAKLAQGGAGKHACDLPGCVSCGNPPDTEGETRA